MFNRCGASGTFYLLNFDFDFFFSAIAGPSRKTDPPLDAPAPDNCEVAIAPETIGMYFIVCSSAQKHRFIYSNL